MERIVTSAQTLAREVAGLMVSIENRLGPGDVVTDAAREEFARAQRSLTALGALLGIAPPPARVEITAEDVRPRAAGPDRCPKCAEKLRLVPTSGFGTSSRQVCGACGYEPSNP